MKRYLESHEDGASKFWEVRQSGSTLYIRWGRIGTAGQAQEKHFADEAEASAEAQKLAGGKLKKGYVDAAITDAVITKAAPTEPVPPTVVGDLRVASGKTQSFDGDVFVNGWVSVAPKAKLVCSGTLTSWGVSLEGDDTELGCAALVTNVLIVERAPPYGALAKVVAGSIRARFVHHEDMALRALIDDKTIKTDYFQHRAVDVNPSWNHTQGTMPLAPELYDASADDDEPPSVDAQTIRHAFAQGQRVFTKLEALVHPQKRTDTTTAERDPQIDELATWLEAHPGPQRATLEALETAWVGKLAQLSTSARDDARRLIKKTVNSPKLAERVDGLCGRLVG